SASIKMETRIMRDHYQQFDHPVLDLPAEPPADLFTEMTQIADELREHPKFIAADLEIAFRQVQGDRLPDLTVAQFRALCAEWRDQYRARQEAAAAATRARFTELWAERDALFSERGSAPPDARSRIDVRLHEIARTLAAAFEARDGRAVAVL